ncbi:hypothetical protein M422DRAFT_46770 [Sphaerobolus stellatus SS14]|uniref:Uncharacterized protein n=1 Tax=Sphaerobolus stellatus (strain SS14) TaxID=990650 RepID=A0A0C9USA9_SPHS4|nr:hypothetical protein M422DRAFT_46770 [Sphaerobolus stellatus SS14]
MAPRHFPETEVAFNPPAWYADRHDSPANNEKAEQCRDGRPVVETSVTDGKHDELVKSINPHNNTAKDGEDTRFFSAVPIKPPSSVAQTKAPTESPVHDTPLVISHPPAEDHPVQEVEMVPSESSTTFSDDSVSPVFPPDIAKFIAALAST